MIVDGRIGGWAVAFLPDTNRARVTGVLRKRSYQIYCSFVIFVHKTVQLDKKDRLTFAKHSILHKYVNMCHAY